MNIRLFLERNADPMSLVAQYIHLLLPSQDGTRTVDYTD